MKYGGIMEYFIYFNLIIFVLNLAIRFIVKIFKKDEQCIADKILRNIDKNKLEKLTEKKQLRDEISKITIDCFDNNTLSFDSELYFRRKDYYEEYFKSEEFLLMFPDLTNILRDNLVVIGRSQATSLYHIIETANYNYPNQPEKILTMLKRYENVLYNMCWIYGGGKDEDCPYHVRYFRDQLLDLLYCKQVCTSDTIKKILENFYFCDSLY